MTGIVLSVNGNICIAIDRDGIVHKFKTDEETMPGKRIMLPGQGMSAGASITASIAAITAAVLLFVIGLTSYSPAGIMPLPPSQETAYYEDGELVIEDADIALAEAPQSSAGSGNITYICWIGSGILAVGSIVLFIYAAQKRSTRHAL